MFPFGKFEQNGFEISIDVMIRRSSDRFIVVTMVGNAQNEHAGFLKENLAKITAHFEEDTVGGLIIDIQELKFCFSACIKVLMSFLSESEQRPDTEIVIGTATWQMTSIRAMGTMMHNLKVLTYEGSLLKELKPPTLTPNAEVQAKGYCHHTNAKVEEFDFFAPTGNGSIVTKCICQDCGFILSETSEYFG